MTTEEYLRASTNPIVVDAFARMERGDINYIDAVERITVQLLGGISHHQWIKTNGNIISAGTDYIWVKWDNGTVDLVEDFGITWSQVTHYCELRVSPPTTIFNA